MSSYRLSAIYVYPVKSLAGISVPCWPVTGTGLKYDRKWMLVDESGRFLSQRKLARMALIKTSLTADNLILSAPRMEDIRLSLEPAGEESILTEIWNDRCRALHVSKEADQWLSGFLSRTCRLVYQADDGQRPVDPRYGKATDRVAYSDGFPFLIVSENSLADLNDRMGCHLPMSRFRPNLVISVCSAYAEDAWREIGIGSINFRLPKPCSRCLVPTIDQETGQAGKEPLMTLNRSRKWGNKVYFGQNALHDQCGELAVGDEVFIRRTGPRQPPLED
ncbi:MAG: MOSC domain-containing protein [Gammaproteobacteria bacterium]